MIYLFSLILSTILLKSVLQSTESRLQTNSLFFLSFSLFQLIINLMWHYIYIVYVTL
jgi:hypothetical protein